MFPNSSSSDVCVEEERDIFQEEGHVTSKQRRLCKGTHLAKLLIDNAKLEVVTDHMLIKCDNEP